MNGPMSGHVYRFRMRRARSTERIQQVLLHGVLLLGVSVVLAPFVWALLSALGAGPKPWSVFVRANQAVPLARYLVNSLLVSGLTASGEVVTASLAAYVFARLHFPGRDGLFLLFLGTLIIPSHVTILPTFILLQRLNWLDSYAALILPALTQPFSVFVLRQYFLTISTELEDAARLDGSSRLGLLWHVFLPLSGPALATVGLFSFLWSWNSFLWPLIVLHTPDRYTLPVGLSLMRSEVGNDWPMIMATALMAALPIIVFFLAAQRWLWRGTTLIQCDG
jgi:multiple sugar transport system permease protein